MGGANSDFSVPILHQESNGTISKFPASIVLEILAAESGGGRILVAYSSCTSSSVDNEAIQTILLIHYTNLTVVRLSMRGDAA